jgi:hypothetical protein
VREEEKVHEAAATDLARLRQDARDELSVLIEMRCRLGEDPWSFLPDLPSIDEQVVATLREERLQSTECSRARARAHHPAAGPGALDRFEFDVLRGIALEHPDLSSAVWAMIGRVLDSS